MAYVRAGMGQVDLSGAFLASGVPPTAAGCDAGYTLSADGSICLSTATYSAGSPCMAASFPFVGTYAPDAGGHAVCQPFSPVIGYLAIGVFALVLFKGGRR
jgi:hypothetical protein